MGPTEPALFSTGLVARLYAPLRSVTPDPEPYARFVAASGEPALELGCGDGDPLLDLRQRGLDVEGLDASPDMLERCRAKAAALNVTVTLHHGRIESMRLAQRYRSIFLAGPTFNLLPDDDTAQRSLHRVAAHLEPGGSVLIPLFIPERIPAEQLGLPREHRPDDETLMRFTTVDEVRDESARCQTSLLRYELRTGGDSSIVERSWVIHWHTQDGFRGLVAETPLAVSAVMNASGHQASATDQQFVFWLTLPDR